MLYLKFLGRILFKLAFNEFTLFVFIMAMLGLTIWTMVSYPWLFLVVFAIFFIGYVMAEWEEFKREQVIKDV